MPLFARRGTLAVEGALLLALAGGCAGTPAPGPGPVPVPDRPPVTVDSVPVTGGPTVVPPPTLRQPSAPAALAHLRGWMPLASAGIPAFLAAHPTWDGRGVLIGILDTGIDIGVQGFDSTSDGRAKVLDLRDFSGEGRVALTPLAPTGDTTVVAGRTLRGLGRVRGLTGAGSLFGGALFERPLGEALASDVNDNGFDGDTLAIVVGKASDGWVLFADTNGDGSLGDERPVHDFLTGRETFGWHRGGEPAPLTLAANFTESGGEPKLDLFFDTGAHGTHVSGIAAARGIGGVAGFNGVAPGAQLIGLKIARNDFGGITTTGSVVAALAYAIRFASARGLPLVINMSFGVGNEREGGARLDVLVDSILAAHPEVVFVTSAGNDGPGLSTVGFPGSAERAITVGATQPAALTPGGGSETLYFFSSRGGELAKPDLVAPGVAWSTIPRWKMGEEFMSGTSMASPYVAGVSALLRSAAIAEHREVTGEDVRRALMLSAKPLPRQTVVDQGAGIPNVEAAWSVLRAPSPRSVWKVRTLDPPGTSASWQIAPGPSDTLVRFEITRSDTGARADLEFSSDVPWLTPPSELPLAGGSARIVIGRHAPRAPGFYAGQVRAVEKGSGAPAFVMRVGVVVPDGSIPGRVHAGASLPTGAERRVVFAADSGRPFRVRIATTNARDTLIAALHSPGGQPFPDAAGIPAGADSNAAVVDVDGRDALAGFYEAVAVAPPTGGATARIDIDPSPVRLKASFPRGDSITATLSGAGDSLVTGRLDMGLVGAERRMDTGGTGGADLTVPLRIPGWVRQVVVDLDFAREAWLRFSDFGLTLVDSVGRVTIAEPVNYARGHLSADLPPGTGDRVATLVLSPGWSDPGGKEDWRAALSIRYLAASPLALPVLPRSEFSLKATERTTFRAGLGELPWPVPVSFRPLALFVVEARGMSWSWQLPILPAGTVP